MNKSIMKIIVGKTDVVVSWGLNYIAEAKIKNKKVVLLRQAILGIWAFPDRNKFTKEQQTLIDDACDAALLKNMSILPIRGSANSKRSI